MIKPLRKGLETLLFAGGLLALSSTAAKANEGVATDTFRVTPDVEITTGSFNTLHGKLDPRYNTDPSINLEADIYPVPELKKNVPKPKNKNTFRRLKFGEGAYLVGNVGYSVSNINKKGAYVTSGLPVMPPFFVPLELGLVENILHKDMLLIEVLSRIFIDKDNLNEGKWGGKDDKLRLGDVFESGLGIIYELHPSKYPIGLFIGGRMALYAIDTEDENYNWQQDYRIRPNMSYGLVLEHKDSPVSFRVRRDVLNLGKSHDRHLKLKALSVQVRLGGR